MDESAKIACCKICPLSEYMKDCKHCLFNVGLIFKTLDGLKQAEQREAEEYEEYE